jgi:hypothetical protein
MNRSGVVRRWATVGGALSLSAAMTLGATAAGATTAHAPRRVRASGTATSILVTWSRPTGAPATSYVVTAAPSGRHCVTSATQCYVKGLRRGKSYRFSVVARGPSGSSARSASSNRIRVATAGTYFVTTVDRAGALIQSYENEYVASSTSSQANADLKKLTKAFGTLAKSLTLESWPAAAKSYVGTFTATIRSLGTDTVNELNADTVSGASEAYFALQTDTNKEVLNEAKVRRALSLTQLIIAPIAKTPSPVALGTSQTVHDFYGDAFSVTASQVVDPATAASGSGLPDAGYRFVAVDLTINNPSTQDVADDANFTTSVTGSDGQTYAADFGAVSGCTNFVDGTGYFDAPPSDSATGCVIFELPTNVTVQSISFSVAQGYLDTAQWSA